MAELKLRLDPCNPGQFYACCGFFELANSAGTVAHFVCDELRPRRAEFVISGPDVPTPPVLLRAVRDMDWTPLLTAEESIDPVHARIAKWEGDIDWWVDDFRKKANNLKCWAGQVTTRKLFGELPGLINPEAAAEDPMNFVSMTKSKFGADPRSAWNALDFGYSPNVHNQDAMTYPAVEMLAAVGLQGFRPKAERRGKIGYSLWTVPLPAPVARAAAVMPWDGLPRFEFSFSIEKRGSYKYFTFGQFEGGKA